MDRKRVETWWLLVPPGLRRMPADLAAVVALVATVNAAVFLPVVSESPLRIVVGLPFVLFVPGYALVAALFPEAGEPPATEDGEGETEETEPVERDDPTTGTLGDRGIDGVERVALSFGLSIAVVPLIGLVLNFTPWGIRLVPIMVATSGFTLVGAWVATRRRRALPSEERFRVPYRAWVEAARAELLDADSRVDAALSVLLVLSVLLAVSSVAFAVTVPQDGESFTEFYLLTEDESGELVADGYPTEFVSGEEREVVVGIGNQEHETVNYTAVVELQRVEFERGSRENVTDTSDGGQNVTSVTVVETEELRRDRTRLAHNETQLRSYALRPAMVGENMRLAFLLYRDSPPENPTVDNAYRETHLWVNVTAA